ncbi:hypothetical protein D3C81_1957030 [compost metagenome]
MFMYTDDLVAFPVRIKFTGMNSVAVTESGTVQQAAIIVDCECAVHNLIFSITIGIKYA